MIKLAVINGPNLNLLGEREPHIYGHDTLEDINKNLQENYGAEVELSFYQSNVEGELINYLQEIRNNIDGIIINAGGYSHTSVAIADCLSALKVPVIEVHLSNIHKRERSHSMTGAVSTGIICGLGAMGYELAIEAIKRQLFILKN